MNRILNPFYFQKNIKFKCIYAKYQYPNNISFTFSELAHIHVSIEKLYI